ncbi:cellulose synthase complex periplasmic endoglucanase BcsZ [Frateuria aurantia]
MTESKDAVSLPERRRLLGLALASLALPLGQAALAHTVHAAPTNGWPEWEDFIATHLQADGRITDFITADHRTTSEAQSYGMFFALVANNVAVFEQLWHWTRQTLIPAPAQQPLPAWLWGQSQGHDGKVLDPNSALDADLWMAYSLLEAGRLWQRDDYRQAGLALLQAITRQETAQVPGLGPMLLPGRLGFAGSSWWKFNPSYLPIQLLRRCAAELPDEAIWSMSAQQALKLIQLSAPQGYAPDWVRWEGGQLKADPGSPDIGSWDAIRTYLWAGMLSAGDSLRAPLLQALHGPLTQLLASGSFAEKVNVRTGQPRGAEPRGYAGALLPYLQVQGEPELLAAQHARIPPVEQYHATGLPYYERVLILFGEGWLEGRFQFAADGQLIPAWADMVESAA